MKIVMKGGVNSGTWVCTATYLTTLTQRCMIPMSSPYEKIENLESTLQALRKDLLRARKELLEVKKEFRTAKEYEDLISEASRLVEKGEDTDPTAMIREMRDKDYDW